jgi:hypothetical protein
MILIHQEGYEPYFSYSINGKTISFNAGYVWYEGKKLVEDFYASKEIFNCTPDELAILKSEYALHFPVMRLFFDVLICKSDFAFPLLLLKELLHLDLTEKERDLVQRHIDEFTCIYLIADHQTRYTKIGKSDNPGRRLKELIRQDTLLPAPNDFHLLFYWFDYPAKERELHRDFETKRIRGEWFDLSDEEIEEIKSRYIK